MSNGWVYLHRQIYNNWVWEDKPFSKGQAWIDIILMVNHKTRKVFFRNELLEVKRGQRVTSEVKLADRWGWSRTKVRNFLEMLEEDNMIKVHKKNKRRTRLEVCNYNEYQTIKKKKKTTEKQQENNRKTTEKQQKNINNELELMTTNDNKKIYAEIIEYLNDAADRNFKPGTGRTKKFINGRLDEGYTVEDFKKVIDKKVKQWKGTEQGKYLRPQTLFRPNNFEDYINEPETKEKKTGKDWDVI